MGTRYGIFRQTESGAVVVVYTLIIGMLIYGTVTWKAMPGILRESVLDTSAVMIMICAASAFGFYLAWEQVPQQMAHGLSGHWNPLALLLTINVLLIVIGTAIEGSSALIILTPILLPIIQKAGIDPVQFGIVMVANLTIAGVTPPVGGMMYIASRVLNVSMVEYAVEILPFLLMMFGILVFLSAFPAVTLWLPNLLLQHLSWQRGGTPAVGPVLLKATPREKCCTAVRRSANHDDHLCRHPRLPPTGRALYGSGAARGKLPRLRLSGRLAAHRHRFVCVDVRIRRPLGHGSRAPSG